MNHRISTVMSTNALASSPPKLDTLSFGLNETGIVRSNSSSSTSMRKINGPLRKKKKSVAFAAKARCLVVPSHRDMTKAEKDATWRTANESKANDLEIIRTVQAARRGLLPSSFNEKVCLRGLEAIICPTTGRRVKQRQMDRINAIIDAQEKEWQEGFMHASTRMLRRLSKTYSKVDANRALMQAASDEAFCRGMRRLEAKAA